VLKKKIQPAFRRIGITDVGWRTFRHLVYSSGGNGRKSTHDPRLLAASQSSCHEEVPAGEFEDQTIGAGQIGRRNRDEGLKSPPTDLSVSRRTRLPRSRYPPSELFFVERFNELLDQSDHLFWILFLLDPLRHFTPIALSRRGLVSRFDTYAPIFNRVVRRDFFRNLLHYLHRNLLEICFRSLHSICTLHHHRTVAVPKQYGLHLLGDLSSRDNALNTQSLGLCREPARRRDHAS
jgi:hypothetical protein